MRYKYIGVRSMVSMLIGKHTSIRATYLTDLWHFQSQTNKKCVRVHSWSFSSYSSFKAFRRVNFSAKKMSQYPPSEGIPSLDDLPDEVLEFILSMVPPYQDLHDCMLVSKRWRRCVLSEYSINHRPNFSTGIYVNGGKTCQGMFFVWKVVWIRFRARLRAILEILTFEYKCLYINVCESWNLWFLLTFHRYEMVCI